MLELPRWKYVLIFVVLVLSTLYALPNVYQKDPSVQITANRGGHIDDAFRQQVMSDLQASGIVPKAVTKDGESLMVRLMSLEMQTRASDVLRAKVGENYTVALNLASTVPDWLAKLGGRPMVLGLDLVGGVHFALQVDQKAALNKRMDAFVEEVRSTLGSNRIGFRMVERRPDNTIRVTFDDDAHLNEARMVLFKEQVGLSYSVSGNTLIARVSENELRQIASGAVEQNLTTLRNRINELGVAEPIIQRQGDDRIVVELPGVQDTAEAKRLIGATATLEFRGVVDGDAYEAVRTGNVPPEARVYYIRGTNQPVLLNKRVIVSGDEMVNATVGVDENGMPAVNVTLSNVAGQRMLDYTQRNLYKLMSVVYIERIPTVSMVDGKEVRGVRLKEEALSPTRIAGVFGKNFRTTGLEKTEAENLSKLLRAGSLAAPMDFVEEYVIGPSLGAENVERGVTAVVFSFLFTLVFFTIYYRMFGVITSLALLFNLLIVVAVMSLFGATMTLPGFAGLALSVGLSVDANVLINERIREELRHGMPPRSAIVAGYDKAGSTILDANLTGLIVGVALYAFGTGPLKGFALTMIIGIFASMFTAITVSRSLSALIYGTRNNLKSLAI
ncbi:protein translocase subunit SecD [Xylella fastidiosa]|uniref:Protein translocase subunit SecD n=1 Tax=Xylella fastidiosa subsp. multiplex TaxID=644357 RepID=A0A9Q4MJW1_XYLFS|nr:protein translocase subunit SecD [Xylella fastidiosa]ERI60431.1 preprotein translocase subunit SecD [Xylella fastidiosa subsp. multiplex Griffin-1]ACA11226.1 protein-export membrane protein SecD [Xylella fastidiosa M12]KAJ4852592.1 protein translocase subunit SecD [Xylella fastidiosa subsp. multiplex]KFA41608.1 preprotein translocase subunit SecD [Xylella fastidiosa]MBE0268141.1 protein translocase subunit SecD [Xylella fastidiosa subsp. multiplex]